MGYIPPLHYSAYHHYHSIKSSQASLPFRFMSVPKTKFKSGDEELLFRKVATNYQTNNQFYPINEDIPTQMLLSKLTGIGRNVNILV